MTCSLNKALKSFPSLRRENFPLFIRVEFIIWTKLSSQRNDLLLWNFGLPLCSVGGRSANCTRCPDMSALPPAGQSLFKYVRTFWGCVQVPLRFARGIPAQTRNGAHPWIYIFIKKGCPRAPMRVPAVRSVTVRCTCTPSSPCSERVWIELGKRGRPLFLSRINKHENFSAPH